MRGTIILTMTTLLLWIGIISYSSLPVNEAKGFEESCTYISQETEASEVETMIPETEVATTEVVTTEAEPTEMSSEEVTTEAEYMLSEEEIQLIALVTMAEAEGECEKGKRLVIDTILNRVDSDKFPNTVHDVIYQPSQFSSMWNGRVERCRVSEDICELVRDELRSRTNYEVIFFTAGKYGRYGTPMFQVGNHYFSSLN